jgi:hypothetical protein
MAIDEIAIEAKKLPMASRAPINAPRTHGVISPFPYPAHPLIRAYRDFENPPLLRR